VTDQDPPREIHHDLLQDQADYDISLRRFEVLRICELSRKYESVVEDGKLACYLVDYINESEKYARL